MPVMLFFASIALTCVLSGFLAVYGWRQRTVPGARAYAGLTLCECLLALAEILSMLSPTPTQALFWFRVRFLPMAGASVFWLVFALEYSGRRDWLSKRLLAGMFIVPAITQVMLWSNHLHGLWVQQEAGLLQIGPFWVAEIGTRLPGLGFLAHAFYSAILMFASIVLLLNTAWRTRHQHRSQVVLVTGAGCTAFVFAIIAIFNPIPHMAFNLFTPGIGLSVLLIALAVFRFQFLKHALATDAGAAALQAQSNRFLAMLLLIFMVMTAGITASAHVSYQGYEQRFRQQAESQLSSIAMLKVYELHNWRKERLGDAELVYRNPVFGALVQRTLDTPTDVQAQAALQAWLDNYQASGHYDRVSLLDPAGGERLSAPTTAEPVGTHLTQAAAAILSTGQVTFVDFHRDIDDGPIRLALVAPILSNHPLGLLVLRIDPRTYLYPYIQQWPVSSASAETQLIRREGTDALFLNELRFQTGTALNLRFPLDRTQFSAVKAALGQESIMEGVDYRGAAVLAALRGVPDSPWFVVAKMDVAEMNAPLRERLWQTVAFCGSLIAALGAMLGLVWRQQRVRYYRGQVETAQALYESEEKFAKAFQTSPYAITITRAEDGKFVDVNDAFTTMTGVTRAEALADSSVGLKLWVNAEDRQRVVADLRAGLTVTSQEYLFRTKRGMVMTGLFSARAIQLSHGPCILSSIDDITERKQAEQRAFELALERERVDLLTKFIQDASHEFRTPLSIIQTNIYLLERLEDGPKRQRRLAQISEQVTSIVRLVELLAEMTRLDSGVPFVTQPVDLNDLVGAEAGKLQGAAATKGLTLHLTLAAGLPPVSADSHRLGRALYELLDNALRYTPAGGSVTVRTAGDAAGVMVEVQDSGPGIPPEALPHIFERFYRQDVAHTTPGFGLGLPIARAIVERHGGRLEVESQPGAGSLFRMKVKS